MPTTQDGRHICPRHQVIVLKPSPVELRADLEPMVQNGHGIEPVVSYLGGFEARIPPVTKAELESIPLPSFGTPEKMAEREVAKHLKAAAEALQAASRAATAAGYGDQFMGSLGETFAQLTSTRGMLL